VPLKVMDIVEQRLAVLQEPVWSGRSVREVCRRHGISVDTFYVWKRRYEAAGLEGLVPRSRRPLRSPGQLDIGVEDRILRLRKDHGWGPRKIRDALRREGLVVPAISTVQQALARRGVATGRRARLPRRSGGTRFVRSASNELWQIDGSQHHFADGSPYWVVDLIDDYSRFCVAALAGPTLSGQLAWAGLRAADAALKYPAGEHNEFVWDEFPHAMEYLIYACLQKGEDDEAAAQILQPNHRPVLAVSDEVRRLVTNFHHDGGKT
jgi:transposase